MNTFGLKKKKQSIFWMKGGSMITAIIYPFIKLKVFISKVIRFKS